MLKQLIDQLSSNLEIEIIPDEAGGFLIQLDPKLQISLRENPESGITLFTSIAPVPEAGLEEFLLKAMCANLFGKETGGNVLGCDKEGKMLTMLRFLPSETTYREFHDIIEDFANYVESWRQETEEFSLSIKGNE